MMQYILDYLDIKEQFAHSKKEEDLLEKGIALYLEENGIGQEEKREYFFKYVDSHLHLIDDTDLKQYFLMYPVISQVKQIAIEQKWDGMVPEKRVSELRGLMSQLYNSGLGDKYVPVVEIKEILGRYA